MEEIKTYEIYTDASFDKETKSGTYAVVIVQEKKVIKVISKRCKIKLEKSTECEIFAIYQALNIILSNFFNNKKTQNFLIKTDCTAARDFFENEKPNKKVFEKNSELSVLMKKVYERISKKLSKQGGGFNLKWIPRNSNKIAHKYSYTEFKQTMLKKEDKEILLINKKDFIEFLKSFNSDKKRAIIYLFKISNEENFILSTQKEISKVLNIPISTVNNIFKKLIKLNILKKIKNGKYTFFM